MKSTYGQDVINSGLLLEALSQAFLKCLSGRGPIERIFQTSKAAVKLHRTIHHTLSPKHGAFLRIQNSTVNICQHSLFSCCK